MTTIKVISRTQRIIVNPANSSVSVINAGPPGPPGVPGAQGDRYTQFVTDSPPTALFVGDQWFNTSNGREYVWYDNFWVEIGTSFQGNGLHVNGSLLTLVAGVPGEITRAALAADADFTSKFTVVVNHGATAATTRVGTAACFWIGSVDPTNAVNNDRLYRTDTTAYYVRVGGAWVESGSSRYAPIAASLGEVAYAQVVATQSGVTAEVDATGLTITFTASATRKYRIIAQMGVGSTVVTDVIRVTLKEGATTLNLADVVPGASTAGVTGNISLTLGHRFTTTAGAHTYKLTLQRLAGTGTVQISSAGTFPSWIQAEDVGG